MLTFKSLNKLVITLPNRLDRMNLLANEMLNVGFNGNVILSNGVIDEQPHVGIGKAHLSAMQTGMKLSNYALIMEDDVQFPGKKNTIPYVDQCLANLPEDWDILLGGVYNKWGEKSYNAYWSQISEFRALHFYIINKKAFERIQSEYKFEKHIDQWISENNFKLFVMNPFCAIQRDNFSDNTKKVTKYNKTLLKKFELLKP